ncbi:MAG TPA: hypothetical protein VK760_16680 [Candidatus Acidoferrales bacterium]|jgi:hypothetical protein|nr:hypothetical protein [Candidatus Acidoferrales bacterium]
MIRRTLFLALSLFLIAATQPSQLVPAQHPQAQLSGRPHTARLWYVTVDNMTTKCSWVTIYGYQGILDGWNQIKGGKAGPRWVAPGTKVEFSGGDMDSEYYDEVRVQSEPIVTAACQLPAARASRAVSNEVTLPENSNLQVIHTSLREQSGSFWVQFELRFLR